MNWQLINFWSILISNVLNYAEYIISNENWHRMPLLYDAATIRRDKLTSLVSRDRSDRFLTRLFQRVNSHYHEGLTSITTCIHSSTIKFNTHAKQRTLTTLQNEVEAFFQKKYIFASFNLHVYSGVSGSRSYYKSSDKRRTTQCI